MNEEFGAYADDVKRRISDGQTSKAWLRVLAARFLLRDALGKRKVG